jgi:hypothetical protein
MPGNLDKILRAAEKVADIAEKRIRMELGALAKSGLMSREDARKLLKIAVKEAKHEKERVRKFIETELKRELKKAKPLIKKALAKKKKQFLQYRKKRKR